MENNNTNNQNVSNEELQKQLQEALEAQKKLQEQIDNLKKEAGSEEIEEPKEVDVDEYLKQKQEKKAEAKQKKTFGEKIKDYGFTIFFLIALIASPPLFIKGKDFLQNLQKERLAEKKRVREALNGDWTSEDGTKLHIDEDGTTYYVEYEGDTISHALKGLVHENMVCSQNTCKENEEETYESEGVDFTREYVNNGSDSYKDYKDIPADSFSPTSYNYQDFIDKADTSVTINGKNFTK